MTAEYEKKPELSAVTAKQLATLYAEVFAAPPWNEVWRCPSCDRFYGPNYSQESLSPCCATQLINAYPEKQTIDYIFRELSQPLAQKRLFYSEKGQLMGFSWGYQLKDAMVLVEKKWPQSPKTQQEVTEAISSWSDPRQPLFYISEVGVAPSFRKRGIGFKLTRGLLDYGIALNKPVVFRTNWASPMARIAARLEMRQIMGPKITVVDNEIVKTREVAGFIDEINPGRTLFIKMP